MWRFLTHLLMVSDGREHPREASLKASLSLDIRNAVKTPLFSKSLPGVLEDMEVPDGEGSGWGVSFVTKRISLDNVLNNIGLIWDLQKEITNVH